MVKEKLKEEAPEAALALQAEATAALQPSELHALAAVAAEANHDAPEPEEQELQQVVDEGGALTPQAAQAAPAAKAAAEEDAKAAPAAAAKVATAKSAATLEEGVVRVVRLRTRPEPEVAPPLQPQHKP